MSHVLDAYSMSTRHKRPQLWHFRCHWQVISSINVHCASVSATDEWRVYSSFSTCDSAVHRHHSRQPAGTSANQGKTGLAANMLTAHSTQVVQL